MSWRIVPVLLLILLLGALSPGCTVGGLPGPGPFYACSPELWTEWEIEGGSDYCTCDVEHPPPMEAQRTRLVSRSWNVQLVAPEGSFPPGTRVDGDVAGHTMLGVAAADGSVIVSATWRVANPQIPGDPPARATLVVGDQRFNVWFPEHDAPGHPRARPHWIEPAGDERFPEGAWAIEDPEGTIDVRIRARGAEHVAVNASWLEIGEDGEVSETFAGSAGTPIFVYGLWPDHTAVCGSYARSFCHCSRATTERGACHMDQYPWYAEYSTPGEALDVLTSDWDTIPPMPHDAGTDASDAWFERPDANDDAEIF